MCNAKVMDCGVIRMYDLPMEGCAFGVMGRDWWGRGVYWQIIGEVLAGLGVAVSVLRAEGPEVVYLGRAK